MRPSAQPTPETARPATGHALGRPRPVRLPAVMRRMRGLYLTTALVAVGWALLTAPGAAQDLRLNPGALDAGDITVDWNTTDLFWQQGTGNGQPQIAFSQGASAGLYNYGGRTITLNMTESMTVADVSVYSAATSYVITGEAGTVLRGNGDALTFRFEQNNAYTVTVDAMIAGDITLASATANSASNGSTVIYAGTTAAAGAPDGVGTVTISGETTLNVTGHLEAAGGVQMGRRGGILWVEGTVIADVSRSIDGEQATLDGNLTIGTSGRLQGNVSGMRSTIVRGGGVLTGRLSVAANLGQNTPGMAIVRDGARLGALTNNGMTTVVGTVTVAADPVLGAPDGLAAVRGAGTFRAAAGGATMVVTGGFRGLEGALLDGGTNSLTLSADTIQLDTGVTVQNDVRLHGTLSLGNTITLDDDDTLIGALTVMDGGNVTLSQANLDRGGADIVVENNAALNFGGNVTNIGALTTAGTMTVRVGNSVTANTLAVDGGTTTVRGDLSAAVTVNAPGAVIVTSGGQITQTGGNAYLNLGHTDIQQGGQITGDVTTSGSLSLGGTVAGMVLVTGAAATSTVSVTSGEARVSTMRVEGGTVKIDTAQQLRVNAHTQVVVDGGNWEQSGLLRGPDGMISNVGIDLISGTVTIDRGLGTAAVAGNINATGGTLTINARINGDVHIATDATLAGAVSGPNDSPVLRTLSFAAGVTDYTATTSANLNVGLLNMTGGRFSVGHALTVQGAAGSHISGGVLTVTGSVSGPMEVSGGGQLHLDGGSLGAVTNTGQATLRGAMASLDNLLGGDVTVSGGSLTLTDLAQMDNRGSLTIEADGVLVTPGGLLNRGTLVLDGTAGAVTNRNDLQVRAGADATLASLTNSGTVEVLRSGVSGSLRITSGELVNSEGATNGTVDVAGKLNATVKGGDVTLRATGEITGGVTTTTTGTADLRGTISGIVDVSGQTTLTGTAGGLIARDGTVQLVDRGAQGNAADVTLTSFDNRGAVVTIEGDARVRVADTATNTAGTLNVDGVLDVGSATNGLVNAGTGTVISTGSIVGTLQNDNRATLEGALGRLVGTGATELSGDLALGMAVLDDDAVLTVGTHILTLSNAAGVTLNDDAKMTVAGGQVSGAGGITLNGASELTISGDGRVDRDVTITSSNATVRLDASTIGGTVRNAGTLEVSGISQITGDLVNDGTLRQGAPGSALTITGSLTSHGIIRSNGHGPFVVNAGELVFVDYGGLDSEVILNGDMIVLNTVDVNHALDITGNARVVAPDGRLNLNAVMTVTAGSLGGNVVNAGTVNIDGSVGGTLTFLAGAAPGGGVYAEGRFTNTDTGVLNSTGTINGFVDNSGRADLSGYVREVINRDGGTLTIGAGLVLDSDAVLRNQNGGIFHLGGAGAAEGATLNADLQNAGTAFVNGQAEGVLNTLTGVMTIQGAGLSAASFTNNGVVTVQQNATLSLTDPNAIIINAGPPAQRAQMQVAGSVTNQVNNSGILTLQATGNIARVQNNSGATFYLGGHVAALVDNRIGGTVEVRGTTGRAGQVDNAGTMTIASTAALTVDTVLTNTATGELTSSGNLKAQQVQNDGRAWLSGRLDGALTTGAASTTTLRGALQITGAVENNGTMLVVTGSTVTANQAVVNNLGMTVQTGAVLRANGGLTNTASPRSLQISGQVVGAVGNSGTLRMTSVQGAAPATISGVLTNTGTATLAGRVNRLVNQGAGRAIVAQDLTLGSTLNNGTMQVNQGVTLTLTQGSNNHVTRGTLTVRGTVTGALAQTAGTVNILQGGTLSHLTIAQGARTNLQGNGTLSEAVNRGTISVSGQGNRVGTVTNEGTLSIAGSGRLVIGQRIDNAAGATVTLAAGGQMTGGMLVNSGRVVSAGTISQLTNQAGGFARLSGNVTQLHNYGDVQVVGGTRLVSGNPIQIYAGASMSNAGDVRAQILVHKDGTLKSNGILSALVENRGTAEIAGRAAVVSNVQGGTLTVTGNLSATRLVNAGVMQISGGATVNTGGQPVANLRGAALTLQSGTTIRGHLLNDGTVYLGGTVTGNIDTDGDIIGQGGRVGGNIIIRLAGDVTGSFELGGQILFAETNRAPAPGAPRVMMASAANLAAAQRPPAARISRGADITAEGGMVIQSGAALDMFGRVTTAQTVIEDGGWMDIMRPGELNGDLFTAGHLFLNGTITGNVYFRGGTMNFGAYGTIGQTVQMQADARLAAGQTMRSGAVEVLRGVTFQLDGNAAGHVRNEGTIAFGANAATGALTNAGTVSLAVRRAQADRLTVNGAAVNNGTVDLADGFAGDEVVFAGGLRGRGVYRLDTDMAGQVSDSITVTGGALRGNLVMELNAVGAIEPGIGQRVTLLSYDTSFGGRDGMFTYRVDNLPAPSDRVVHIVRADDSAGEINLFTAANPAVGAISGNIALTQSLIGAVINRPSSPFTSGLGFEDESACRPGAWGRVMGGKATATGGTRGGEVADIGPLSVESTIDATYSGLQVGGDFGCYDGRFGDWTVIAGAILGVNTGATTQPVYAFDPGTGQVTDLMTSINRADFDQTYGGIYISAIRGPWVVDLQLRRERTAFSLDNEAMPGFRGLQLEDPDFSSTSTRFSGALSYSHQLGSDDSPWVIRPIGGFSWSRTSTDEIRFKDARLQIEDSTSRIGFAGVGVTRTHLPADGRSAVTLAATATYYKDFSRITTSTFTLFNADGTSSSQRLESDNLGGYGEISLGASYVRLMESNWPFKQMNASIRVDGRKGSTLDSYGITGQIRFQF
ncbi:MAG: hypothetical protein Q4G25_00920 [Paracoccus sp. (in: a-proteobacteria)]|nr:hypothetical protein [Paracoccus sp. (in: a-proteobacteria)]